MSRTSDSVIVSLGFGSPYVSQARRLAKSLAEFAAPVGIDYSVRLNTMPNHCPSHQDAPFAFKVYCILDAIRQGYKNVLWLDANMYAVKSVLPIFERIQKQGYWFVHDSGWTNGQWCTDAALPLLRLTREHALTQPVIFGGWAGFNTSSALAQRILDGWARGAIDGSFVGPFHKGQGFVSDDPRVLGHRHDQTVLSTVIAREVEAGVPVNIENLGVLTAYKTDTGVDTIIVKDGSDPG